MRKTILIAILAILASPALAKDHASQYQVGTLLDTQSVHDVNVFGSALSNASTAFSHNEHVVQVANGSYVIVAPTSAGASILMAMATNNQAPADIHIRWFMDDMHAGDKVLFYAECNKHDDCIFYLPKPDQPGKEFHTNGHFYPAVAKTNTTQLCGTGRLSPAVEAQVCQQPAVTSTDALAATSTDARAAIVRQMNDGWRKTGSDTTATLDGTVVIIHGDKCSQQKFDELKGQFSTAARNAGLTSIIYTNDRDLQFTDDLQTKQ